MKFTDRLRDYGLTLEEDVIIHDRRVVDASADIIDELESALREMITSPTPDTDMRPSIMSIYKGSSVLAKLEKLNRD